MYSKQNLKVSLKFRNSMVLYYVTLVLLGQVQKSRGATCFIFSFFEIPLPAQPVGRIYLVNPGPNFVQAHVTTPLLSSGTAGYLHEHVIIEPYAVSNITVTPATILQTGCGKENKGILVISSDDITVQTMTGGTQTSDSYSVPPIFTLGTEYVVALFFYVFAGSVNFGFSITSTADNTLINITLYSPGAISVAYNGTTYSTNGSQIRESLNKYQTLQIDCACDLSGTRIKSNLPIFVVSGAARICINTIDHHSDVLPSIDQLGTEYFITQTPNRTTIDMLHITAITGNSACNVTDHLGKQVWKGTLNANSMIELYILPNMTHTVRCSKPTVVTSIPWNVNGFELNKDTDTYLLHRLPMEQMTNSYVLGTMSCWMATADINFVQIISRTSDIGNITLNGLPLDDSVIYSQGWTRYYNSIYSSITLLLPRFDSDFYNLTNKAGNNFAVYMVETNHLEASAFRVLPLYPTGPNTLAGGQRFLKKSVTDMAVTTSYHCTVVPSRLSQCSVECMTNSNNCAGFQFNGTTCCLLSYLDIKYSPRITQVGSEIWEWNVCINLLCG